MRAWVIAGLLAAVVLALAVSAVLFAPAAGSAAGGDGPRVVPARVQLDAEQARQLAHAAPVQQPRAVVGWSNLMTEDFEGTFPGTKWQLVDNPTWGKVTYRKYGGSYSAYAVGGGSAKINPPGPYSANRDTRMVSGPYNLSSATDARLDYYHWTRLEYTSDYKSDDLGVLVSIDGRNFYGVAYTGDWTSQPGNVQGWMPGELDLRDVSPLGSLVGKPSVWIMFRFVSDASLQMEGTYLDDVALRIYTGPTPTPTATPTPASTCPGASKSSYLTTDDNENNALTHQADNDMYSAPYNQLCYYRDDPKVPIEFRVIANNPPGMIDKAQLNLRVYDVDEQDPTCAEVDTVLFNSTNVGKLTGADKQWSTTSLNLTPSLVKTGDNLVQVLINTLNCPDPLQPTNPQGRWCTSVDWGELALEGGQGAASIRSATIAKNPACYPPGSSVPLQVEVDSSMASQEVRTEVNILDANDINLVGRTQVKTIHSNQDDPFSFDLPLPADAATQDYRVQIIVVDTCSETQNAYRELPLTIDPACGTPTPTPTPTPTRTATPGPTRTATPTPTASATAPAVPPLFMPLILR